MTAARHLASLTAAAEDAGRVEVVVDDLPEAVLQAVTGLMWLHGRDRGVPERLGLDVASAATGLLAGQGLLAGLVARRRGLPVSKVEVSGLSGALQFLLHHLAIATGSGTFPFPPGGVPGSPFATADGAYVEIEVLSGDSWIAFWRRLGLTDAGVVGGAWLPYVYRYLAARCDLPPDLSDAVRRHDLAEVRAAAESCGAAVAVVRAESMTYAPPPWTMSPFPASPPAPPPIEPARPLDGMVVVEATSRLQGPLAGLLLRHLGAEVIKIEPPGGDFGRHSPPLAGETGAAYLAYNRGKRVVEIDYKRPSGLEQLRELATDADVFLHNWRPGRAEGLGLDGPGLARLNPRAVHAYASGWGEAPETPAAIAGDFVVQAYAGTGALLRPPGEPPLPSRLTLVDVTGGLLVAEAVLAALLEREHTGRGAAVTTSLVGAAAVLASEPARGRGPLDQPLATPVGHLVVVPGRASGRARLARACGLPEPAGDEAFARRLAGRPAADWVAELAAAGVPAAVCRTDLADLPSDPLLGGLLERVDDVCWVPAPPWRFDA